MTDSGIDSSVAILRALLTEDFETYSRLNSELDRSANKAFAAVLGAAFTEAVNRRFDDKPSPSEIITFVANTRAAYERAGQMVSAEDAEHMIRAALGEDHLVDNMTGHAMGTAQTAVLFAIVHDNGSSAGQIDDLLKVAEARASSYFRRNAR